MKSITRNCLLTLLIMSLSACASDSQHSSLKAQSEAVLSGSAKHAGKQSGNSAASSSTPSAAAIDSKAVESQPLSADPARFAQEVSDRYGIPVQRVQALLSDAQFNQTTYDLMKPKGRKIKKSWPAYRKRFVENIRIRKGTAFWNSHRGELAAAEQKYGVPASIICAIIGVETVYGNNMGSIRLLDSLHTLGFNHPDPDRPDRHLALRNQLAALIHLDAENKLDARTATGSFAGAMGLPQFMPLSIEHFAVDGDGDGKIDLRNSSADAINSVANFLVMHGWQRDMPVFAPVNLPANPKPLVDGGLEPSMTWAQLQAAGASSRASGAWQHGRVLGVVDLKDEVSGNNQYKVGTNNFFAITKYNNSYFYATSVADLARELQSRQ